MNNQFFDTKYGPIQVDARPLYQTSILYTLKDIIIPANTTLPDGQVLKQAVRFRQGTVLIPRSDPDRPGAVHWQLFRYGLYEALRSCLHIRDQYERGQTGEIAFLEKAYEDIHCLALELLQYRRLKEKGCQRIERQLDSWWQKFETAINQHKQEVGALLEDSQGIQDRLGRRNPTAIAAKLEKTQRPLSLRLEEIRQIEPRLGIRMIALLLEKNRIERVFGRCYQTLSEIYQASKGLRYGQWQQRDEWKGKLINTQGELKTVMIGPFPVPINRMREELWQAVSFLTKRETREMRPLVWKVMQSLRCQAGRKRLEDIILSLDLAARHKRQTSLEGLTNRLEDFLKRLNTIDDRNFKVPVRAKVRELVAQAQEALKNQDLKGAKGLLKKAARAL